MVPRVLTSNDPEPAVGSVVLDRWSRAWQGNDHYGWLMVGVDADDRSPYAWLAVVVNFGPVTLIHDGGVA